VIRIGEPADLKGRPSEYYPIPGNSLLRKSRYFAVFRASGMESALKKVEFPDIESSERVFGLPFDRVGQGGLGTWFAKASERQMRTVSTLLAWEADLFHGILNAARDLGEFGWRHHACPEDTRAARIREESNPFDLDWKRGNRAQCGESLRDFSDLCVRDFPQKFQGKVNALRPSPTRIGTQISKRGLTLHQFIMDFRREIDGDEGAHGLIAD